MRRSELLTLSMLLASLAIPFFTGCGASSSARKPRPPRAHPTTASTSSGVHRDSSCTSPTWDITYELDGTLMVTGTILGFGDTSEQIGPGAVTLRFADRDGSPAAGPAKLLAYEMRFEFTTTVGGMTVETKLKTTGGPEACGVATGTLDGLKLRWDRCTYGPTHGVDALSWTPDNAAEGPGCITNYKSRGTVNCIDDSIIGSCSQGNLKDGVNVHDEMWNQPLNTFSFSKDLKTFTMRGEGGPPLKSQKPPPEGAVETTDRASSYSWFNLDGTEIKREESCACP